MSRAEGGFTLLELLIVMTIVALATAMVLPRLSAPSGGSDFRAQAREVAARLRLAQLDAVEKGVETAVTIDLAERTIVIGGKAIVFPADTTLIVKTARGLLAPARASIRFVPLGGSTGGSIEARHGGRTISIRISWLTGAVTLAEGSGS